MNVKHTVEYRLWGFIDGTCSFDEKIVVKSLIANNEKWNKKYHELTGVHQLITDSLKLDEPSPGFLEKVMEKIDAV